MACVSGAWKACVSAAWDVAGAPSEVQRLDPQIGFWFFLASRPSSYPRPRVPGASRDASLLDEAKPVPTGYRLGQAAHPSALLCPADRCIHRTFGCSCVQTATLGTSHPVGGLCPFRPELRRINLTSCCCRGSFLSMLSSPTQPPRRHAVLLVLALVASAWHGAAAQAATPTPTAADAQVQQVNW